MCDGRTLEALRAALNGDSTCVTGSVGAEQVAAMTPASDERVALVATTSGSTGSPAVVDISPGALIASASLSLEALGGWGVQLLALPMSHVAGCLVAVRAIVAGSVVHQMPVDRAFTAAGFVEVARQMGGERRHTALVPTQLRRVLADPEATDVLAGFSGVLVGGAGLSDQLRQRAREAGIRLVSTYGMTETTGGCVYNSHPLPGVQVVAEGGVLRVASPTLALGYRTVGGAEASGVEAARAARWLTDERERQWFVTSDRGQVASDGRVEVRGRVDDVILSGGENVDPLVTERVVGGADGVFDVVVVGVDDDEWGQRVVAVVELSGASQAAAERAIKKQVEGLPAHQRPKDVVFAQLPRLPLGKPDRVAARVVAAESLRTPSV